MHIAKTEPATRRCGYERLTCNPMRRTMAAYVLLVSRQQDGSASSSIWPFPMEAPLRASKHWKRIACRTDAEKAAWPSAAMVPSKNDAATFKGKGQSQQQFTPFPAAGDFDSQRQKQQSYAHPCAFIFVIKSRQARYKGTGGCLQATQPALQPRQRLDCRRSPADPFPVPPCLLLVLRHGQETYPLNSCRPQSALLGSTMSAASRAVPVMLRHSLIKCFGAIKIATNTASARSTKSDACSRGQPLNRPALGPRRPSSILGDGRNSCRRTGSAGGGTGHLWHVHPGGHLDGLDTIPPGWPQSADVVRATGRA